MPNSSLILQLGENRAISQIVYNPSNGMFLIRVHMPIAVDPVDGKMRYRPIEVSINITNVERVKLIYLLGGTPPPLAIPPGQPATVISRTQGK
jgi:hypothetical protein